jgi:hypothetical protein
LIRQIFKIISAIFISAILFSCGGPESYKTPIVYSGDIVQSECRDVDPDKLIEEEFSADVVNGDVVVVHSNILAPENTVMGILDTDSNITYEGKFNYYYLEASEQFITLREKFKVATSLNNCYYDLRVRITNVSGGIYDLMLFDQDGKLIFSKEVRVR